MTDENENVFMSLNSICSFIKKQFIIHDENKDHKHIFFVGKKSVKNDTILSKFATKFIY